MEVAAREAEVDSDHAVLDLAEAATPLLLDPGGLVPLLGVAGLVDDPDGVRADLLSGDDLLEPVEHQVLAPLELAEELLEGAWGDAGLQGDRLDAFLGQVGELPADVGAQMGAGVLATEAVAELVEEGEEFGLQPSNLLSVHALPSGSHWQGNSLAGFRQ